MSVRNLSRGWVGLMAALLLAPAAGALDITNLSITITSGTNSADVFTDSGANRTQVESATSITLAPSGPVADTVGSNITFETQYASLLAANRENPGGAFTQPMISDYTITFTVDNPTGAAYQVDIDTLRVGALTLVTDDAGSASVSLGAVTGTLDAVVDGSLALAAFGPLAGSAGGTSAFDQPSTTLTITDTAISRTFTLGFNWSSSATSNHDEAAIRMGIDGGLATTTADDYSLDGRSLSSDGHFVDVKATIISVPEPASGALVAFGVLGLAIRAHRIHTRRR